MKFKKDEIYTTQEEFELAKNAVISLKEEVQDGKNPVAGAVLEVFLKSIGECEAFNKAYEFVEKTNFKLDKKQEEELETLYFEMQLAKSTLLKAIKSSGIHKSK